MFLVLGLWIIPNAAEIINLVFPSETQPASATAHSSSVIGLTIVGVWLVDLCSDTLQSPVRMYMIDVTPLHQQDRANSLFGIFVGLGGGLGYLSGSLDWLELG